MGFVEAKNLFDESDGVYFITGLVGLRAPLICKKKFLGYVYLILLHAIYCYCFILTIGSFVEMYELMEIYSKSSKSRILQAYFNPFFIALMVLPSVINSRKILHTSTELGTVDEKLKLINSLVDFPSYAKLDFIRMCEIIICTIIFNLLEYFPQVAPGTSSYFVFVWIVNSYPQFVNSIVIASFGIFMAKIRRRFETVNKTIAEMKIFGKTSSSNLENDMNNVFNIRLINKMHEKLVNAATNLSEAYGFVLLTSFTIYCIVCCSYLQSLSQTFGNMTSGIDLILDALWLIFYLGKCAYVIDTCHSVTLQMLLLLIELSCCINVQGKLAGRLLREKWTDVDHHPLKQETDLLIRQIEARNLQLTAHNFFVIDYAALKMIIVALAAYLIVVSQPTASCDENPK